MTGASPQLESSCRETAGRSSLPESTGLEKTELDNDLFDLGTTSLMFVRIAEAIRGTFHVDLPLSAVFKCRTARSLSETLLISQLAGHGGRRLGQYHRAAESTHQA
jgi:hypothetical protein